MIESNPSKANSAVHLSHSTMKRFILILALIFSVETALASRQSTLVTALSRQAHTAFIRADQDVIHFADGDGENTVFVRQRVSKDSNNQKRGRFTRKHQQRQPEHSETNNGTPIAFAGKRQVKVAPAASTADTRRAKNPIVQYGEYMPLYTGY